MRKKVSALVVTFAETSDAMAMERYCQENQIPGRLIPIPRQIHAGCGLAWKAAPEDRQQLLQAMQTARIRWESMEVLELWG